MILQQGMKVEVVLLPPEDDPDSFAKAHDRQEIEEYIATHKSDFITFKTNLLLKDSDNDPIRKTQLINDIIESVSMIPDQIERNVYIGQIASRFDIREDSIFQKVRQLRSRRNSLEQSRSRMERNDFAGQGAPSDSVPAGYDAVDGPAEVSQEPARPLTDAFLAVNEKEIIYYLLKFGEYPLYTDDDLRYGDVGRAEDVPTVSDYIRRSLEEDDLQFENPVYRKIYSEYFNNRPQERSDDFEVSQGKIIRYFSTHPDQNVSATMMDVICDNYPITIKVYRESLTPEDQTLGKNVPRAVIAYRIKVIDRLCAATVKEVDAAFKSGDGDACKEKMRLLAALNTVKNNLTKELNRL